MRLMDRLTTIALRIGDWRVNPTTGQLSKNGESVRLEARTLRLLMYLANRAGETVSIDELLDHVWSGVVVTQDSVYQAVTSLRRLLGDDARQPAYIVTVPRLGYRLVASVRPWENEVITSVPPAAATTTSGAAPTARMARRGLWITGAAACAALAFVLWRTAPPPEKSVAVLPFLDITSQEMNKEYFADGMTEELINRLGRLPGFAVPSATDSFYFKGRNLPLAEIAGKLRVTYLLDGSVRESGDVLRVSVRLVRAADGYLVWSENFDRRKADTLKIQDEIATRVAEVLGRSVR
jgi:TolB-like protein/DNA-binding winged helix-turn-helix (wHTH) protein